MKSADYECPSSGVLFSAVWMVWLALYKEVQKYKEYEITELAYVVDKGDNVAPKGILAAH